MNDNKITKAQLKHLVRPITYALLLAIPDGLTTEDITYLLNNTRGIRGYKLSFDKIEYFIKKYKSGNNLSVFIQQGDKWLIRELNGGYIV